MSNITFSLNLNQRIEYRYKSLAFVKQSYHRVLISPFSERATQRHKLPSNKKYILDTYNDSHPDDQLPKIRIHDFRHSHVSMLINSKVDTFIIAVRLGHSKQMVENVYGHLFSSKKKEILNVLNNVNLTPQTLF